MWPLLALCVLAAFPLASGHGRVTEITTSDGTLYTGWNPEYAMRSMPPPRLVAWSASNLGNIFVPPSRFNTSDISCHFNATPGALHVNTTAGDTIKLRWNEWPVSHVGPVMTYLAACNGSCADVDKNELGWVKLDELGWLNSTGWDVLNLGGTWASDVLIANDYYWTVRIPDGVEEGYYVLRHEIIALHVAEDLNGAQAYPQCINLRVTGTADQQLKSLDNAVLGSKLYKTQDPGILINVHRRIEGYVIPGPKVWAYATPTEQPSQ
jgi:cellulase